MDRAATEAADSRDDAAQECVWKIRVCRLPVTQLFITSLVESSCLSLPLANSTHGCLIWEAFSCVFRTCYSFIILVPKQCFSFLSFVSPLAGLNWICRPGWSWLKRPIPAPVSWGLEWRAHSTTSQSFFLYLLMRIWATKKTYLSSWEQQRKRYCTETSQRPTHNKWSVGGRYYDYNDHHYVCQEMFGRLERLLSG